MDGPELEAALAAMLSRHEPRLEDAALLPELEQLVARAFDAYMGAAPDSQLPKIGET